MSRKFTVLLAIVIIIFAVFPTIAFSSINASIEVYCNGHAGYWDDNQSSQNKVVITVKDDLTNPINNANISLALKLYGHSWNYSSFNQTSPGVYSIVISDRALAIGKGILTASISAPGQTSGIFSRDFIMIDDDSYFPMPPDNYWIFADSRYDNIEVSVSGTSYHAYDMQHYDSNINSTVDAWLILDNNGNLPPSLNIYSKASKTASCSRIMDRVSTSFLRDTADNYRTLVLASNVVNLAQAVRDSASSALGSVIIAPATGGTSIYNTAFTSFSESFVDNVLGGYDPSDVEGLVRDASFVSLIISANNCDSLANNIDNHSGIYTDSQADTYFSQYKACIFDGQGNMEIMSTILPDTDLLSQVEDIAYNVASGVIPFVDTYVFDQLSSIVDISQAVQRAQNFSNKYLLPIEKAFGEYSTELYNYYQNHPAKVGQSGNIPFLSFTTSAKTVDASCVITWIDADDDSNAEIRLYKDNNNSGYDGTFLTGAIISENDSGSYGVYTINTSSYANGEEFYVYATINDKSTPIQNSSNYTGKITVSHSQSGNDFNIEGYTWDDDYPGNLINGIPEGQERLEVEISFRNVGVSDMLNVRATLSSSSGNISFANGDDYVYYGDILIGDIGNAPEPDTDFGFDVTSSSSSNTPFAIHIKYEDIFGTSYYQDIPFTKTFPQKGTSSPQFVISNILIDDSADGNNNGLIESGENNIKYKIQLRNNGNALATQVRGTVSDVAQITLWDTQESYPDINPGESKYPNGSFSIAGVPKGFSGNVQTGLTVEYGPDHIPVHLTLTLTVNPAAWMSVSPRNYDFGVIQTPATVSTSFTIYNNGTSNLIISSINTGNPDTTISVTLPITISPAGSRSINVQVNTSALADQFITRTLTINSNALKNSSQTFTITGTILSHYIQQDYHELFRIYSEYRMLPDKCRFAINNVVTGDSDNDGLPEIIFSTYGATLCSGNRYAGRFYIYEKTADNTFTLKYTSPDIGGIQDGFGLGLYDIDGDGYLNILVLANSVTLTGTINPRRILVYDANGNNSWVYEATPVSISRNINSFVVGNADNDANPDIVYDDGAFIHLIEYSGSYIERWVSPQINDNSGFAIEINSLKIIDSDKDGNSEIIFLTPDYQVYLYERNGDNSFTQKLYFRDTAHLSGGDFAEVACADGDLDGLPEIHIVARTSGGPYYTIIENLSNDSWNVGSRIINTLTGAGTIWAISIRDYDNDIYPEIAIGSEPSQYDGLRVWKSVNSVYQQTWTSPQGLADAVMDIAFIEANSDPYTEIVAALGTEEAISVIQYYYPMDAEISQNGVSIIGTHPYKETTMTYAIEGNSITFLATINNTVEDTTIENLLITFYYGDPGLGGTKIADHFIPEIGPLGSVILQQPFSCDYPDANFYIYVDVDPLNNIYEGQVSGGENNNRAIISFLCIDDDKNGPVISDVVIEEENGDGDEIIEDNELVKISWSLQDAKGISSTVLKINGVPKTLDGNYYVIEGPLVAGQYSFSIEAADNDNTSASSIPYSGTFSVSIDAPEVVTTSPLNSAINVKLNACVIATFNTDVIPGSLTGSAFYLKDAANQEVLGSIQYDSSTLTAYFCPQSNLINGVQYTSTIKGGASGIKDTKSDPMAVDKIWSFTTEPDVTSPFVSITSPVTNENIKGIVSIHGTATDLNLISYDLFFGLGATPVIWNPIGTAHGSPVINSLLETWDTTALADGIYTIKLVASDFVPQNSEATVIVYVDNTAPSFGSWSETPLNLQEDFVGPLRIKVTISDAGSGLTGQVPQIDYYLSGGFYDGYESMINEAGNTWYFDIDLDWGSNGGKTLYYKVRCRDVAGNIGESAEQNELIEEINDSPVITSTPKTKVVEGENYLYDMAAYDEETPGTLIFSLNTKPTGMTIDAGTGLISWTPDPTQVGINHSVQAAVTDGLLGDTQSWTIYVIPDSDGDKMPDDWETANGLNPNDPSDASIDGDGDLLTNLQEYFDDTDPNVDNWTMTDTDGDGMPDDYELSMGLQANTVDAAGDLDNDRMTNLVEYLNGTDPGIANSLMQDSDGDGLPDYWEIAVGLDPAIDDALLDGDNDLFNNMLEYLNGTRPDLANGATSNYQDGDADRIPDLWELAHALTGSTVDTDQDNLANLLEYYNGTDPQVLNHTLTDQDQDGMPDQWENAFGLDPTVDDSNDDPDGDGISNINEYLVGSDPFEPNANYGDVDADGMPDYWEAAWGVDGSTADPDGDGIENGDEYRNGLNPIYDQFTYVITVTPGTTTIHVGDTVQFTVTGDDLPSHWAVSNPGIGTITQGGVFTAAQAGSATIILKDSQLVVGTAAITVSPTPPPPPPPDGGGGGCGCMIYNGQAPTNVQVAFNGFIVLLPFLVILGARMKRRLK